MDLPFCFDKVNRRLDARFDCALAVRWRAGQGRELGYVSNLSLSGFCLRTRKLHRPGFSTRFTVSRDSGDVHVLGTVAWVRQLQVESHVAAWHEMGIRLESPVAADYTELLSGVSSPEQERRHFRRFSHSLVVRITYEGRTFRAHSVDISNSGVLFLCDDLPPLDATVAIDMRLPGTSTPVQMEAQVVRRVEGDPDDKVRGFAVRFLNLGKGEEQMFINYLKIARELRGVAASV
jgi:hypothetical protein